MTGHLRNILISKATQRPLYLLRGIGPLWPCSGVLRPPETPCGPRSIRPFGTVCAAASWLVQGDPGTPELLRLKLVALVAWPLLRATSLDASTWIDNWLK
jgi:hypothetical protein